MFYNVLELKELVCNKEHKLDKRVLLERGDSSLCVIALQKHEVLENHFSVCDACAYVFEGEAEFHFEAEKFTVKKGELIIFEKEKEHKVLALKDTKFMLIKI